MRILGTNYRSLADFTDDLWGELIIPIIGLAAGVSVLVLMLLGTCYIILEVLFWIF